ncbi:MAG: hypothetical protein Aurels2KO_29740 [Aureliella sp.]
MGNLSEGREQPLHYILSNELTLPVNMADSQKAPKHNVVIPGNVLEKYSLVGGGPHHTLTISCSTEDPPIL